MSDLAERAVQAFKAEEEAKAHEQEAQRIRAQNTAERELSATAEARFGIASIGDVVKRYTNMYDAHIRLTDDAVLVLTWNERERTKTAQVMACDQLYWDLPPGVTVKGTGGGTYGRFGLPDNERMRSVESLADVGKQLERVSRARELWNAKHGITEECGQ